MLTQSRNTARLVWVATVSLGALGLAMGGLAAPAAAADGSGAGEVIVTAQRRAQRLQDVPAPISVLASGFLKAQDIRRQEDLALFVPGLLVQEQSPQRTAYNLRGLTEDYAGAAQEPLISILVDDIDTSRQQGAVTELLDIDHIDVVRGPQGTLYGRGSVNGVISIYTTRPTNRFEAHAMAEVGNYNAQGVSLIANAPLVDDRLALRVAVSERHRDGYVKDVTTGGKLQGQDANYGRATLRWTPTAKITSDLILTYQRERPDPTVFKSYVSAPAGGNVSPYTASGQNRPDARIDQQVGGATLDTRWVASPKLSVESIAGYRVTAATEQWDGDGSSYSYIIGNEYTQHHQVSEELRANYEAPGGVHMVFGANVFHEIVKDEIDLGLNEQYLLGGKPTVTSPNTAWNAVTTFHGLPVTTMNISDYIAKSHRTNESVFLNLTKTFLGRVTVDVGARYTHDEAKTDYTVGEHTTDGVAPLALPNGLFYNLHGAWVHNSGTFSYVTPRVSLTYKLTPDWNLFAGVGKGERSGIADFTTSKSAAPTPNTIAPELVWNYEAGLKGRVGRIYIEGSVFYYDYTNLQVLDATTFPARVTSAGAASGRGFELTVHGPITDQLSVYGTYAYTDAHYDRYISSSGVNYSGNRFRLAPEHKLTVSGTYERPVTDQYRIAATLTAAYQSKEFFNIDNLPYESQGGYTLVNGSLALKAQKGWEVEAFANNLFDQKYLLDFGNTGKSFGMPTTIRGEPRTFGLRFKIDL
ncbi:MAG: TonB-dependent receptor [Caulobacteraceae bacterium]|nr:TonB-dependent receptor [Caulobacteraceae bacterium]